MEGRAGGRHAQCGHDGAQSAGGGRVDADYGGDGLGWGGCWEGDGDRGVGRGMNGCMNEGRKGKRNEG